MIFTVYSPITGQISYNINGVTEEYFTNNESYIVGQYYDNQHYIDIGTKDVVNKPTQPSNNHVWDWATKSWQLDLIQASLSMRQQRNNLLSSIDRMNPIWYASLSSAEQQELAAYRIALLNVPQQAGFPETIEWPTKPTWL